MRHRVRARTLAATEFRAHARRQTVQNVHAGRERCTGAHACLAAHNACVCILFGERILISASRSSRLECNLVQWLAELHLIWRTGVRIPHHHGSTKLGGNSGSPICPMLIELDVHTSHHLLIHILGCVAGIHRQMCCYLHLPTLSAGQSLTHAHTFSLSVSLSQPSFYIKHSVFIIIINRNIQI